MLWKEHGSANPFRPAGAFFVLLCWGDCRSSDALQYVCDIQSSNVTAEINVVLEKFPNRVKVGVWNPVETWDGGDAPLECLAFGESGDRNCDPLRTGVLGANRQLPNQMVTTLHEVMEVNIEGCFFCDRSLWRVALKRALFGQISLEHSNVLWDFTPKPSLGAPTSNRKEHQRQSPNNVPIRC